MERIQKYINRIYRASVLDRELHFEQKGLKGCQLSYILQIVRQPGLSQDDLSGNLFVHKSSVTRHVQKLLEDGFVYRETDPLDSRKKLIFPTEKAEQIYPEIIEYLNEWNAELLAELTDVELEHVLAILRKLTASSTKRVRNEIKEFTE